MAVRALDLERLLAPVPVGEFFESYFEKKPLVLGQRDPRLYDGLLGTEDVETLVFTWSVQANPTLFHMARNGRALGLTPPLVDEKGRLRTSEVVFRYGQGFTIVLNQLERRWLPLADLCAAVERDFAAGPVQLKALWANAYLTPPGAQGYPAHYDDHDVFVLQVEGAKRWNVYAPLADCPLEGRADLAPEVLGEPRHALELQAGDLMYLPRGHPHEAATSRAHSLHVTIAVWPLTWLDVLDRLARDTAALRRAARRPPPEARDRAAAWERGLSASMEELVDGARIDSVVKDADRRRRRDLMARPGGHLAQINRLQSLDLDTALGKWPGEKLELVRLPREVSLSAPGRATRWPPDLEDSLRVVMELDEFSARSLPVPWLDDGKLDLARKLVAQGLVRVVASEVRGT